MKKAAFRSWVSAVSVFALSIGTAVFTTGCPHKGGHGFYLSLPILIVSEGVTTTANGLVTPFNFGDVPILGNKTQIFTIRNIGTQAGVLGTFGTAELGLASPFTYVDTVSGQSLPQCVSGQEIAPNGGACIFSVNFEPTQVGNANGQLSLSYADVPTPVTPPSPLPGQPAPAPAPSPTITVQTLTLQLTGKSHLDCNAAPVLVQGYNQGVQNAQTQMAADAIRGQQDGAALTFADGQTAGYSVGYNEGYPTGYNGPNGYSRGYAEGKTAGFNVGRYDTASCNSGRNAGHQQGVNDGTRDGDSDGYNDGYEDGFAAGGAAGYDDGYDSGHAAGFSAGVAAASQANSDLYDEGYNDGFALGDSDGYSVGYSDGSDACFYSSDADTSGRARSKSEIANGLAVDPAQFVGACVTQGYNATYSTSAYWNAYNTAKANNPNYQSGYSAGRSQGRSDGEADGAVDGRADGYDDGYDDGFAEGSLQQYNLCYNNEYPGAYLDAYTDAYSDGYSDGSYDGVSDAYDAAWNEGYDDGYTPGYNAGYNASLNSDFYDDGYSAGYYDGWDYGYSAGYDDGYYDWCGSSLEALSSVSTQSKAARAKRTGFRPRVKSSGRVVPTTLAVPLVKKAEAHVRVAKAKKASVANAPIRVSASRDFSKLTLNSRKVQDQPNRLRSSVELKLAGDGALASFQGVRNKDDKASFRSFLRDLGKSKRNPKLVRRRGAPGPTAASQAKWTKIEADATAEKAAIAAAQQRALSDLEAQAQAKAAAKAAAAARGK